MSLEDKAIQRNQYILYAWMQQNKKIHRLAARERVCQMKIFITPSQDKCDCIKQLSAVA